MKINHEATKNTKILPVLSSRASFLRVWFSEEPSGRVGPPWDDEQV